MTASVFQKPSLSPALAESIVPYLDDDGSLPFLSTTMFFSFFRGIQQISGAGDYDHPLLLRTVTQVALEHPRYKAYRTLEENSGVTAAEVDSKISKIVRYYLLNGGFSLNLSNMDNPTQVIQTFQQAYQSKKNSIFESRRDWSRTPRTSPEFLTLKALLLTDDRFLMKSVAWNGAIAQNSSNEISKRLKNSANRDFVLAIIKINGKALEHLPTKFNDDKEIVLAAVRKNGHALQYANPKFQADREMVLAAIENSRCFALEYASPELKADRDIVSFAVKQQGSALQFASPELRADRDIVSMAVKEYSFALNYASEALQNDPEMLSIKESSIDSDCMQRNCAERPLLTRPVPPLPNWSSAFLDYFQY